MSLRDQVESGSSNRLDFPLVRSKVALLIVDVQKYLSTPQNNQDAQENSYLFNEALPKVIENIHALTDAFRSARDSSSSTGTGGCEVVFVYLQSTTNDGRDISLDYKLSGSRLANIPNCNSTPEEIFFSDLKPNRKRGKGDIMVPKTSCSVFVSTNLDFLLRNLGIEQVVITGQLTDQCVESAVRDAADLGYFVTVAEDACAATSAENHVKGLHGAQGFARIVQTAQVLEELANSSEDKAEEAAGASAVAGGVTDEQVIRYLEYCGLDNALYELEQHLRKPSTPESNRTNHIKENGGNQNKNAQVGDLGDLGLATVAEEDDGPSAASSVVNEESETQEEEDVEGTLFEKEAVVVKNREEEEDSSEGEGDESAHSEESESKGDEDPSEEEAHGDESAHAEGSEPKGFASFPDENEARGSDPPACVEAEADIPSEPAPGNNSKRIALSAWAKSINSKYTEHPEEEEEPPAQFDNDESLEEDSIDAFSEPTETEYDGEEESGLAPPPLPPAYSDTSEDPMLAPMDDMDGGSALLDTVIEADREETETSSPPDPLEIVEASAPENMLEEDFFDGKHRANAPESHEKEHAQDGTDTEEGDGKTGGDADLDDGADDVEDDVEGSDNVNDEVDNPQQQQATDKRKGGFFGRFSRRGKKEFGTEVTDNDAEQSLNDGSENENANEEPTAEQETQQKKKRGFFGRGKKEEEDVTPEETPEEPDEANIETPQEDAAEAVDQNTSGDDAPDEKQKEKKRGFFGRLGRKNKKEDETTGEEPPTGESIAAGDPTAGEEEEEKTEIKQELRPDTDSMEVQPSESLAAEIINEPNQENNPAENGDETAEAEPQPEEDPVQDDSKQENIAADDAGLTESKHKEKKKSSKKGKSGEKTRKAPKRSKSKENLDDSFVADTEKESKPKKSSDHERTEPGESSKKKSKKSSSGNGDNGDLHDSSASLEKVKKKKPKRSSAGHGAGEDASGEIQKHRKSSKQKKESKKKREEVDEAA